MQQFLAIIPRMTTGREVVILNKVKDLTKGKMSHFRPRGWVWGIDTWLTMDGRDRQRFDNH